MAQAENHPITRRTAKPPKQRKAAERRVAFLELYENLPPERQAEALHYREFLVLETCREWRRVIRLEHIGKRERIN
jgi:hypothetical protein